MAKAKIESLKNKAQGNATPKVETPKQTVTQTVNVQKNKIETPAIATPNKYDTFTDDCVISVDGLEDRKLEQIALPTKFFQSVSVVIDIADVEAILTKQLADVDFIARDNKGKVLIASLPVTSGDIVNAIIDNIDIGDEARNDIRNNSDVKTRLLSTNGSAVMTGELALKPDGSLDYNKSIYIPTIMVSKEALVKNAGKRCMVEGIDMIGEIDYSVIAKAVEGIVSDSNANIGAIPFEIADAPDTIFIAINLFNIITKYIVFPDGLNEVTAFKYIVAEESERRPEGASAIVATLR